MTEQEGTTRLVQLLRSNDWDGVRTHLSTSEGQLEARTRSDGGEGCFPLCSRDCAERAPNDIVISLIKFFPDALVLKSRLTTTYMCRSLRSGLEELFFSRRKNRFSSVQEFTLDIMKTATRAKPECLSMIQASGGVFLHTICHASQNPDIVQFVLNCYPEGAFVQNSSGKLALHRACQRGVNDELRDIASTRSIIQMMLERYSDAAKQTDHGMNTPLHYACRGVVVPSECTELLLNTYPTAAAIKNVEGKVPLHIMCERQEADQMIALKLISCSPTCILVRDNYGKIPFDYVMEIYRYWLYTEDEFIALETLNFGGILLYCTYRNNLLGLEPTLQINDAKPSNSRERLLCISFTAHLLHPGDFEQVLDDFSLIWPPHIGQLETEERDWFPSTGEDTNLGGNTPLHLLWNRVSNDQMIALREYIGKSDDSEKLEMELNSGGYERLSDDESDNRDDDDNNIIRNHDEDDYSIASQSEDDNSSFASQSEDDNTNMGNQCENEIILAGGYGEEHPKTHARVLLAKLNNTQRMALASHRNNEGEIPLHRLLKYGRPNIVHAPSPLNNYDAAEHQYYDARFLLDIYPESCYIVDPSSNLYPFMLAAAVEDMEDGDKCNPCVSTIYYLLKRFVAERPLYPIN